MRTLAAELAPTPRRWWRAARVASVTATGAAVMAILQIVNPLGLTMLFNFGVPEAAFSLGTALAFLAAAAIVQSLGLALVGALVDAPSVHLVVFIIVSAVSSYLIYALPRLGRLWIWVQVLAVTAFYLVIFKPDSLGWDSSEMFASLVIAVAILMLFNNALWPEPAASVLADSLATTLDRSRRRLALLVDIFRTRGGAAAEHDRPVASKLGYHLTLLQPAARDAATVERPAALLGAVMVAQRIHNEIDRIALLARAPAVDALSDEVSGELGEIAAALDSIIHRYTISLTPNIPSGLEDAGALESPGPMQQSLAECRARVLRLAHEHREDSALSDLAARLLSICDLLIVHPWEYAAAGDVAISAPRRPPPVAHRFLVRFSIRHTIAMTLAFIFGLFANNAALHAALWLLMIGGPPSHGATVRKFIIRAIGVTGALMLAALGTIALAPNFTSLIPYSAAIFAGAMLMAYLEEGGGLLSYLSIGGTAFVIAFSGPGPRTDILGSLWTIWGMSLGMVTRAVVSSAWSERASRTLVEQFQGPLDDALQLMSDRDRAELLPEQIAAAEAGIVEGLQHMLAIANDAHLEGRTAGIDSATLVDALDTFRRVAFILANLAIAGADVPGAPMRPVSELIFEPIRARFESWLDHLRRESEEGAYSLAPLRDMVRDATVPELAASARELIGAGAPRAALDAEVYDRLLLLMRTLEEQLGRVSLY